MDNWLRIDENGPIEIGNIVISQNFLGGLDEDWFILIHIEIEAKAALALAVIPVILEGIAKDGIDAVINALEVIKDAWTAINLTMNRMPEACDPYIYYNRVRPYIHGWKNNSVLTEGLIYEGVEAYGGKPQQFRGETGAQSAIVPTMDALFNITHERDLLWEFLMEMRDYMPPKHRAFVEEVEKRSTLRDFVKTHGEEVPNLRDLYDGCISLIEKFRTQHLEFAARYINKQTAQSNNDPNVGTGGTPFMQYLKKHRDESSQHLLK
jgi:indoleamine 2,3-dioxygenase